MTPFPARAWVRRMLSPLVWQRWAWCMSRSPVAVARVAGPVLSVAFDRSGTLLASASSDGLVQLWDVRYLTGVRGVSVCPSWAFANPPGVDAVCAGGPCVPHAMPLNLLR